MEKRRKRKNLNKQKYENRVRINGNRKKKGIVGEQQRCWWYLLGENQIIEIENGDRKRIEACNRIFLLKKEEKKGD